MNNPYYSQGRKYEPIDVINDWNLNFNLGSALKYISRLGRKDGTEMGMVSDLNKAIDYLKYERDKIIENAPELVKLVSEEYKTVVEGEDNGNNN